MKAVGIQNVTFFPKNGEVSIHWRGETTLIAMTQGGVMVQIKGYDNYFICCTSYRVFSKIRGKYCQIKHFNDDPRNNNPYCFISRNGTKEKHFIKDLMRKNIDKIHRFLVEQEQVRD